MRRLFLLLTAATFVLAALAGCARQQSATDTAGMTSDSLLAANPMEPPAGDITPQTDLEQPAQEPQKPAPAPAPKTSSTKPKSTATPKQTGVTVEAGTPVEVNVGTQISSETASVGDAWTGQITENVIVGDRVVFPAGSTVSGTVTAVKPAEKGSRALLNLAVTSITANGKTHSVDATMEALEAGSTRARNLGVIAGGAGAGALIGKAVGGSGKGAAIGAAAGAAAAAAGVVASKGYQVVVKEGTVLGFKVTEVARIPL